MKYFIGKGMELAGIVLFGFALYTGIALHSERLELVFVGIGGAIFLLGWLLERRQRG